MRAPPYVWTSTLSRRDLPCISGRNRRSIPVKATAEVEGQADVTLQGVAERAVRAKGPVHPRRGARPVVLTAVCAAAVAVSMTVVLVHRDPVRATSSVALPMTAERLQGLHSAPYLVFRSTRLDSDYGRVQLAPAKHPEERVTTALTCDRVDVAGGRGICLTRTLPGDLGDSGVIVFDDALRTTATIPLAGYPSRARVSPDGRYGAVTRFARGDTYASLGKFSTRTDILDLTTGKPLLALEKLRVTKDGKAFRSVDFNFWGVTFLRDGEHFYATLGSGSHTYLIRASLRTRTATVITDGVECPSLSPDETRIAFKERDASGGIAWHLAVLDLQTLSRHRLATIGDIDDQARWKDDRTVSYGLVDAGPGGGNPRSLGLSRLVSGGSVATSTWSVPAAGGGAPQRELAGSWSTTLVQP